MRHGKRSSIIACRTIPLFTLKGMTCFLIAMLLSLTITHSALSRSLHLVTEPWEPFVYVEDGQPTGVDFEVVRSVFEQMGIDIHVEFLPWKRCLNMIKEGEADALLDVSITTDRLAYILFPEEPLSNSNSNIFYLNNKPLTYHSLADLSGMTIGTQFGYSYSADFDKADNFTKEPVSDIAFNIRKLMAGRIDAFIANRVFGEQAVRAKGLQNVISFAPTPISGGNLFIGFSRKRATADFVRQFDHALQEFKKTSGYAAIRERYSLPVECPSSK
ncbi:Amino acid ABC transporter substrate-binding protein, PAAT family [Pseudodesulfovibrio profundus]|uniref:Amino acid ABC transporter substrate-binding protein, PAAT family n=1 Tax=Pseudodesulfovibrio profundus TaxID=57320 RepID=A0A2C8F8R8_9BACT|nr:transporter substrate-binding domain-containing protein [Pseudodesulfovibrio profundus]SOB58904.1 Amino acid ABC transporter substrate-binding protein, PAAT family [Pseudodesulfovibrio profundus]